MTIYSISTNTSKVDVPITKEAKRSFSLMSKDCITLKFSLLNALRFDIGDYCFYNGARYELTSVPSPQYNNTTGGYDYNLTFDAEHYKWKNKIFKYTPEIGGQEASWTLTATLDVFVSIILKNLTHLGYTHSVEGQASQAYVCNSGCIDASVENKAKNISFDNTSILDAMTQIAKEWDCDWWLEGNQIHFGAVEFAFKNTAPSEYSVGDNLVTLSRNETKTLATRIYPFGSTKNVPYSYRKHLMFDVHKEQIGGVWHITDASRPLESEWFDSSLYVSQIKTYEQTLSGASATKTNKPYEKAKDKWSEYVRNSELYTLNLGSVSSDKIGSYTFSLSGTASDNDVVEYTYTDPLNADAFQKPNATSLALLMYNFHLRIKEVAFTAVLYLDGVEVTSKSVVSESVTVTERDNTYKGVVETAVTCKAKIPKIGGFSTIFKSTDAGKSLTLKYFAVPTFHYVDDDGKDRDDYISEGYVCYSKYPLSVENINFWSIESIKFSYGYKAVLKSNDYFPRISCRVQFYKIVDHAYVTVGSPYEVIINDKQDALHISDITLSAAPPDAPYFGILELPEYKVKGYYLRSDAFLYGGDDDYLLNGIAKRNLMLPIRAGYGFTAPYLESESGLPEEQYVEQVVVFDDVFPRTRSKVTKVASTVEYATNEDDGGSKKPYYTYYLQCGWEKFTGCDEWGNEQFAAVSSFVFDDDYKMEANTLEITFTSGKLNGMTFEVGFHKNSNDLYDVSGLDANTQTWEIIRNDTYGITLPGDVLMPSVNDTFVLTGWNADCIKSMGLIDAAEQELLTKAQLWLNDKQKDPANYDCTIMADTAYNAITSYGSIEQAYQIGSLARVYSEAFFGSGNYRDTHIIGYEYNLDYPYDNPKITLGETPTSSRLSTIEGKVEGIIKGGIGKTLNSSGTSSGGGASVYLIKRNDKTAPLDTNTFSAQRIIQDFLRKNEEDTAAKKITFAQGIGVGIGSMGIDGQGNIAANDISSRDITAQSISSPNFSSGQLGGGYRLSQNTDGKSLLEIDNLLVRYAAQFTTISYNQLEFVAGNRVLSAAGGEIASIVPLYSADGNSVVAYKCFLNLTDTDGNTKAKNYWALGDQARCQSSDEPTATSWEKRDYWRRVIDIGDDFITLSNQDGDYDPSHSDTPMAGDSIVQLGNGRYKDLNGVWHDADTDRQNAIMFEVVGIDGSTSAPSIKQYKGINSFTLDGRCVTKISPDGNEFTGDFRVSTGGGSKTLRTEIADREYFYITTATFSTPDASGTGWKDNISNVVISNTTPYLWKKTIIHYNDKDDVDIEFISKNQKGADGSIVTAIEQYYTSTTTQSYPTPPSGDDAETQSDDESGIDRPSTDAVWYTNLEEVPYDEVNKYLWRYTMTFYSSDGGETESPEFSANIELMSVYGQHGINGVGSLYLDLDHETGIVGLDPTTSYVLAANSSFQEIITCKYGSENATIDNLSVTYTGSGVSFTANLVTDGVAAGSVIPDSIIGDGQVSDMLTIASAISGNSVYVVLRFKTGFAHDSGSVSRMKISATVSYSDGSVDISDTIEKTVDISFTSGGAKGDKGDPTYSLQLVASNLDGLTTTVSSKEYQTGSSLDALRFTLTTAKTCQVRAMKGSVDGTMSSGSVSVNVNGESIPDYDNTPLVVANSSLGYYRINDNIITVTLRKVPYSAQTYTSGDKTFILPKTCGDVAISCGIEGNNGQSVSCVISIPYTVDMSAKFGEYEETNERFLSRLTAIDGENGSLKTLESKIEQTAEKISLKVGERSAYRNIIPSSRFEALVYKYGDLGRTFHLKAGKYLFSVRGYVSAALAASDRIPYGSTRGNTETEKGNLTCHVYTANWSNSASVKITGVSAVTKSVFLDVSAEDDYIFMAYAGGQYKAPLTYNGSGDDALVNGTEAATPAENAYVEWAMLEDVSSLYTRWQTLFGTAPTAENLFDGWTDSNIGQALLDTGIDIEKGNITLTAGKISFQGDDPNYSQLKTLVEGGTITTNKIIAKDDSNILRATLNEGDDGVFRQYDGEGNLIMIIDSGIISFCDGGTIEEPNIVWQLSAQQRAEMERWTDYNKKLFKIDSSVNISINNGFADNLPTIDTTGYRANHYYYNGGDSLQRDLSGRLYQQMYSDSYYWLNTNSIFITNGYVYPSEEDSVYGAYYVVGFKIVNGLPTNGTKYFFDSGGRFKTSHTAGASPTVGLYDHIIT